MHDHPEFEPAYVREILDSRRDRIPPAARREALASLQRPHDNAAVLGWIARFLGLVKG